MSDLELGGSGRRSERHALDVAMLARLALVQDGDAATPQAAAVPHFVVGSARDDREDPSLLSETGTGSAELTGPEVVVAEVEHGAPIEDSAPDASDDAVPTPAVQQLLQFAQPTGTPLSALTLQQATIRTNGTLTADDAGGTTTSATTAMSMDDAAPAADLPAPNAGEVLVVTTLADTVDASDGVLSLREAMTLANADAGLTTITFASGLHGTIRLVSGQLSASTEIAVLGDNRITLSGDNGDGIAGVGDTRILSAYSGAALQLDGLRFDLGFHIYVGGLLGVDAGASVIATNTQFSNGLVRNYGGAIANLGNLELSNVTFDGNQAGGGSAIFNSGTAHISNATFANNHADVLATIFNWYTPAHLVLTSSTVTGNSSGSGLASVYGRGGGSNLVVENSIITGNGSTTYGANLYGGTLQGVNIIGDERITTTDVIIREAVSITDVFQVVQSGAGVLADNGGPVDTVFLKAGGAAIDRVIALSSDRTDLDGDANTTEDLPLDARNLSRVSGGAADLGAVEFQRVLIVSTLQDESYDGKLFAGEAADGDGLSLREAIGLANDGFASAITFDEDLFGTIRLTLGEILVKTAMTIDGDGRIVVSGDALGDDVVDARGVTDVLASGAALLDDNHRLLDIGAFGTTTLKGLTLTGGRTSGNDLDGGAIRAQSGLTLIGSTVAGNSTAGFSSSGGGIYASGALTLVSSTVSGNFTFNTASGGGGIFSGSAGGVELINTTIAGNGTGGTSSLGGGVFAYTIDLQSSTVTSNSTVTSGSSGGGLFAQSIADLSPITLTNSIVSGNVSGGSGDDLALGVLATGSVQYSGGNIVGDTLFRADGSSASGYAAGDIFFSTAQVIDADGVGTGTNGGVLTSYVSGVQVAKLALGGTAVSQGDAALLPLDPYDLDADGVTAEPLPTDAVGIARIQNQLDLGAAEARGEQSGLVVTTLDDVVDPGDGLVSLREALDFAGGVPGAQTITFAGGLAGTVRLTGGTLTVTDAVTIDGDGRITISGDVAGDDTTDADGITDVAASAGALGDNVRLFDVASGAPLTLDGLVLTGGHTSLNGQTGGAVRSASDLVLVSSVVAGNSTSGGQSLGGAIFGSGDITIVGSTVHQNRTEGLAANGGGVYGTSAVTLVGSTVSGNATLGASAQGGGVMGYSVTAVNSTFAANATLGLFSGGGGVLAISGVTALNSTFTGNSTAGSGARGGGIYSRGVNGEGITLVNSIVKSNVSTATANNETWVVTGAGASLATIGGNILGGQLLAGATVQASGLGADDVFASTAAVINAGGAVTGVQAGLLADNGGAVPTVALLPGGLAANAGDGSALPGFTLDEAALGVDLNGDGDALDLIADIGDFAFDARGAGFERTNAGVVDLGAFEVQFNIIAGTPGADSATGTSGDDFIQLLGGNDVAAGGEGSDRLEGGDGGDVLLGGPGRDLLHGGAGSDVLSGDGGSDVLQGGSGFDALSGVDGGAGVADTLFGGADLDIAYYFTADSSQVVDFNDRTNIANNSGEHTLDTWDSIEGFYGANAYSNTITGNAQDNLFLGGDQADVLYGGGGSDILTGRGGNDVIYGGIGNDFISGDAGDDTIHGGAGEDTFYVFATSGIDRIRDYSEADDGFLFYQTGATQWSDLAFTVSGNDVHITRTGSSFTVIVEGATLADLDNSEGNFAFL